MDELPGHQTGRTCRQTGEVEEEQVFGVCERDIFQGRKREERFNLTHQYVLDSCLPSRWPGEVDG
jgi:hypothetical protein